MGVRASVVVVLGALLTLHCSSDPKSSGTGSPPDSGTATNLTREAFIAQYCELAKPCCDSNGGSIDKCTSDIGVMFPPEGYLASVADACLTTLRENASRPYFCSRGLPTERQPACASLNAAGGHRASVALGGQCFDGVSGSECIPPADGHVACVIGDGGSICQHTKLAAEGEPCLDDSLDNGVLPPALLALSRTDVVTPEGGYCNRPTGVTCKAGTCVKQQAIGAACTPGSGSSYGPCATGAYCAGPTCIAVGADGAACNGPDRCASGSCGPDTRCSSKVSFALDHFACGRPAE